MLVANFKPLQSTLHPLDARPLFTEFKSIFTHFYDGN